MTTVRYDTMNFKHAPNHTFLARFARIESNFGWKTSLLVEVKRAYMPP